MFQKERGSPAKIFPLSKRFTTSVYQQNRRDGVRWRTWWKNYL